MASKISSIDVFVKDAVIDFYSSLPVNAAIDVVCRQRAVLGDGTGVFELNAQYRADGVEKDRYFGIVSLDKGEELPNHAVLVQQMLGKYGIEARLSEGTAEARQQQISLRTLEFSGGEFRRQTLTAGLVAEILGIATAQAVNAYRTIHTREPVGETLNYFDLMQIAGKLGFDNERILNCLEAFNSR
jgi:hypothetical protein